MEKDIGKIQKNDQSDIVIRIDDFGGSRGLTIREFVTSERYTGFTKAGVRIKAPDFEKFKEMINSITPDDMKDEATVPEAASAPGQETLDSAPNETPTKAEESAETVQVADGDMPDY